MMESEIGGAHTSPVAPQAALTAEPGRVMGLVGPPGLGLTRLGLALLSEHAGTVAVVDVRGWLSPLAAWEVGLTPECLVVVRCPDRSRWAQVTAALLEGMGAVYAEVPGGTAESMLRRLGALARARRSALLLRPLRGGLPPGVAHLQLQGEGITWMGAADGHGRLTRRLLTLQAAGKGVGGVERQVEVEDDGTDAVRVVPGLAAASSRRAAG